MHHHKKLNIAYIGGGSRQWARNLMADLALDQDLSGEVRLYDIDYQAALDNAQIGALYQDHPKSVSHWTYVATQDLKDALIGADFVVISIMPATFKEMEVYTHHPEKYGIYQAVGDTIGPAGIMRALITTPIFVDFGKMIKKYAPDAWVINFTNPMTMCLQALVEGYPEIKTYGNCHEVFGSQLDLAAIYNASVKEGYAKKDDVFITVSGINHFTWITQASCHGVDLMPLYDAHVKKYGDLNTVEKAMDPHAHYPFSSASKVKYDLYQKHHCMAAAGDRHLAEFFPVSHYLDQQSKRDDFKFHLTPIKWRIENLEKQVELTNQLIRKEIPLEIKSSGEEGIRQIKALCGLETLVTNINHVNHGQAFGLPLGHVVETNALFDYDKVSPIYAGKLPKSVESMVHRHINTHQLLMESYRHKDLNYAIHALSNDPLSGHLSYEDLKKMFEEMVDGLTPYLDYYL